MRIVLVRHGEPGDVDTSSISGRAIGEWLRGYDDTGITSACAPPRELREQARSTKCLIASDLRRARESASWLAELNHVQIDPDLREAGLPESLGISVRLSPGAWVILARVAWFLSWGESMETIAMARERAGRVADRLDALAAEHESVMVVGHGMFNRFLAGQLRRRGWRGPRALPHGYWTSAQFARFERPA